MRKTLVIQGLGCGGAERVLVSLANAWHANGDAVSILTLDDGGAAPFFRLDPGVSRHALDMTAESKGMVDAFTRNLARIGHLRRAIRETQPNVVVSFGDTTNVLVLLATIGTQLPVIVSERCDPRLVRLSRAWSRLRTLTYPRAAAVVVQTHRTLAWFSGPIRKRAEIIPNPVWPPPEPATTPAHERHAGTRTVLAVGRLEHQKGFDLLLRAFGRVAGDRPAWRLRVVGEGSERERLESLADAVGIVDRVTFEGRTNDIASEYASADLFVLASRFEGFPNALTEAMASGVPVISTDCPSGPREIVTHGVDGLLVPSENVEALAGAMAALMDDEASRRELGTRSRQIAARLSQDTIMAKWDNLVARIVSRQ